ncbi:MAG: PocR ligand-binding domain-containing protein [Bacillota bacterium]
MSGSADYSFADLVDLQELQKLQDTFSSTTGLATSVTLPDGTVLSTSGWTDFCASFHRKSVIGRQRCLESDREIFRAASQSDDFVIHKCHNGLFAAAMSIRVEGADLATLVVSQVFFEEPDEHYFRKQARELGFDEESYLEAVRKVPVVDKRDFYNNARFLGSIAKIISSLWLQNKRQKVLDEQLQYERNRMTTIFQNSGDAMRIIGKDFKIIDQNKQMELLSGVTAADAIGRLCFNSFHHPFCGTDRCILRRIQSGEARIEAQMEMARNDGRQIFVSLTSTPFIDEQGNVTGVIEIFRDITEEKQMEEKLRYLSLHDALTGLFNRAYFEEEMGRLTVARHGPVSIIVCDVDALKIINDTLGHDTGDEYLRAAAEALKKAFRTTDCVARVGGDEFATVLPSTDNEVAEDICSRIRQQVAEYNRQHPGIPLSLSIGRATTGDPAVSLSELYREADSNMYREKLLNRVSKHKAVIEAVMAALRKRGFITEGRTARLQSLAEIIGKAVGLSDAKIAELRLLARFRDVGMVGIPDRVLLKQEPLTPAEKLTIQRHCEIGHRIALTIPELSPIAESILKHHEWWDGTGYPLGLRGEDIPVECRIQAIVDAYDAITRDEPARRALSAAATAQELRQWAGSRFDPDLVNIFVHDVLPQLGSGH